MAKVKKQEAEEALEKKLWKTADKLRKNMDAAEYKHIVLGLIFLKYISDAFEELYEELVVPSLRLPACSARRDHGCPDDRAWFDSRADKLRCRAGFRDKLTGRRPCKETGPSRRSSGVCSCPGSVRRIGETRMKEESPSVVRRSICQNSSANSFRKSCGSIGLTAFEFKSITTFIGLNSLYCNDLYPATGKTLGQ